jgi:hypothetical protein
MPKRASLKNKVFKIIRVCDLLAAILSSLLIAFYYISSKAWYLSDIISVSIIGTCLKIFKIKNLKYL